MTPRIVGLTMGDRYGIGPEIVARLCRDLSPSDELRLVVVGDRRVFDQARALIGTYEPYLSAPDLATVRQAPPGWVFLDRPFAMASTRPLGRVDAEAGREALDNLGFLLDAARDGRVDGVVYAPMNKNALRLAGLIGEDELDFAMARLEYGGSTGELNLLDRLWTARVTSHVPLRRVADLITPERILAAVRLVHGAVAASGVADPKIAVAGLNPHAGDGGAFGTEEIEIIAPAVAAAREEGFAVEGPFPADTLFVQARTRGFDAIVTMYHDQGQIAMKLMGFGRGITVLAGLPFPVVTPAHGTAFDIAGQGWARADGLVQAVRLCGRMLAGASGQG